MGQTLAWGPPTSRIQDDGRPIHRLHRVGTVILDVDTEKTLGKSFDKTISNKE